MVCTCNCIHSPSHDTDPVIITGKPKAFSYVLPVAGVKKSTCHECSVQGKRLVKRTGRSLQMGTSLYSLYKTRAAAEQRMRCAVCLNETNTRPHMMCSQRGARPLQPHNMPELCWLHHTSHSPSGIPMRPSFRSSQSECLLKNMVKSCSVPKKEESIVRH